MGLRRAFDRDRRIASRAGYQSNVQTITLSGAAAATPVATQIKPFGLTRIVSTGTGGPHFVALAEPIAGLEKFVVARMNSTADVALVTHSTACLFDGTTFNRLTFSTAADGRTAVHLIGVSTALWAILGSGAQANTTASPTPAGYALAASTIAP